MVPLLSAVLFAIRSTVHTTLDATPAELIFGRDMILPIQIKADWDIIKNKRQKVITKSNIRENRTRIPHTYSVGDKIMLEKPGIIPKMLKPRTGPHTVTKVYSNGTIDIQRGPIRERVNIRRVTPYREDP